MKRVKSDVLPWKKLKNNWSKEIRKKVRKTKELSIQKKKKNRAGKKKERDGLMQRMSRGRDQWQLNAHETFTR